MKKLRRIQYKFYVGKMPGFVVRCGPWSVWSAPTLSGTRSGSVSRTSPGSNINWSSTGDSNRGWLRRHAVVAIGIIAVVADG